jgi:hypothetical protein
MAVKNCYKPSIFGFRGEKMLRRVSFRSFLPNPIRAAQAHMRHNAGGTSRKKSAPLAVFFPRVFATESGRKRERFSRVERR